MAAQTPVDQSPRGGAVEAPYRGLLPYTEDYQAYFFGRDRDVELLVANVQTASVTVYYGEAGVGKSSVLMASAIPRLRDARRTMTCLFRTWQLADLDRALKEAVSGAATRAVGHPIVCDPARPFDEAVIEIVRAYRLSASLVFDQFEEYFTYHPESPEAERFEVAFARLANDQSGSIHFLLSMREDAISKLDRFQARIPHLLGNMLRLDYLTATVARECVERPLVVYNAAHQGSFGIEPALVDAVLRGAILVGGAPGTPVAPPDLTPESRIVAPVLQIVLAALWDAERRDQSTSLRLATLKRLGGSAGIFNDYVDRAIRAFSAADAGLVAAASRYLVNAKGGKIAQPLVTLAEWMEVKADTLDGVLRRLAEGNRILRRVDVPGPGILYELFHDVLGPALLAWRQRFLQAEAVRRAKQEATEQRRRTRWKVAGGGAVLVLVAVAVLIFFAERASRARERAQFAEQNAQYADERRRTSELERRIATLNEDIAASQRRAAELETRANQAATPAESKALREQANQAREQAAVAQRNQLSAAEQAQRPVDSPTLSTLNESVLIRLMRGGDVVTVERLGPQGLTLRGVLDPLPFRVTLDGEDEITRVRMNRVRQIEGWGPGEFRTRVAVDDGALAVSGTSPTSFPSGRYRVQLFIADHKAAPQSVVLAASDGIATITITLSPDARKVQLTSPVAAWDAKLRSIVTAPGSKIDGLSVEEWLASAHREQRKASLLNLLALLRAAPVASRSLIDDVTTVFSADDRQVLIEVKPAFKDYLYSMASEPNRAFYSEGRPASALKTLDAIRRLRNDSQTYLLTSFRGAGKASLQIILAAPADESSERHYAALGVDDGSALDAASADAMNAWKLVAATPAKPYLYYTVVEGRAGR